MLEGLKDKDEGGSQRQKSNRSSWCFAIRRVVGDVAGRSDRRMAADGSLGIITALKGSWPFTRMLF